MATRQTRLVIRVLQEFASLSGFRWNYEGINFMEWTGAFELRKLTVSWTRTPTVGAIQDPAMCTFHFLNLTDGEIDTSWTASDYAQIESAFDAFWTARKGSFHTSLSLAEYLWRADGPAFRPFGEELAPTLRVVPRSVAGANSVAEPLPPQCAMSVTEVTTSTYMAHGVGVPGSAPGTGRTQTRNRWGRFYLPGLCVDAIDGGRFTAPVAGAVVDELGAFYNACVAADFVPVMYSPTLGDAFSIDELRIDDIVDVIRSRRFETPVFRDSVAIDAVS